MWSVCGLLCDVIGCVMCRVFLCMCACGLNACVLFVMYCVMSYSVNFV